MLGPIRKFSSTIYAKILLSIIVIPFVFWGMGNVFGGGSKNIVVVIDDELLHRDPSVLRHLDRADDAALLVSVRRVDHDDHVVRVRDAAVVGVVGQECVPLSQVVEAEEPHEANLFDMDQKYADVMPLAEVKAALAALTPGQAGVEIDTNQ